MKKQTLKLIKVLLVAKQPVLVRYRRQKTAMKRLPLEHRRMVRAGEERHKQALARVVAELKACGIDHDVTSIAGPKRRGNYDLLLTVGGDGTLFRAAHRYPDLPVLSVNSDPVGSTGFLCRGNADDFPKKLARLRAGKNRWLSLVRLRLCLDGKQLPEYVLNDLLVADSNPALQSRYHLSVGGRGEIQRSSGLWVATATGSSSVISNAGAKAVSLSSRVVQFAVREPCCSRGSYRLVKGRLAASGRLKVRSMMIDGRIYLDGAGRSYRFGLGSELVVDRAGQPLLLAAF